MPGRSSRAAAGALSLGLLLGACTGHRQSLPQVVPRSPVSPSPADLPTLSPGPTPSPTPTIRKPVHWITSRLHTDGELVVDAKGHPVRLLGIGIPGVMKGQGSPDEEGKARFGCNGWKIPPPSAYDQIRSWGFNSVRLAISWANLEPTPPTVKKSGTVVHHYNGRYLTDVDRIIRGFTERGVAVVIDMHQGRWSPAFERIPLAIGVTFCEGNGMPTWLYPAGGGLPEIVAAVKAFFRNGKNIQRGFIDTWRFIAKRYRKNRLVVGADILNEPYDILTAPYPGVSDLRPKDLDLAGFYEKVGAAIHEVDPNLLLIFEENISRRTGRWALARPPVMPNAVFSLHFSQDEWVPTGLKRLNAYYQRAKSWGLPMWIGEFTSFGASTPYATDPNWQSDLPTMLAWSRKRDISWTVWSYNPGWFMVKGTYVPKPGLVDIFRAGH